MTPLTLSVSTPTCAWPDASWRYPPPPYPPPSTLFLQPDAPKPLSPPGTHVLYAVYSPTLFVLITGDNAQSMMESQKLSAVLRPVSAPVLPCGDRPVKTS